MMGILTIVRINADMTQEPKMELKKNWKNGEKSVEKTARYSAYSDEIGRTENPWWDMIIYTLNKNQTRNDTGSLFKISNQFFDESPYHGIGQRN